MSFARQQKRINEQSVFNPPPGYYDLPAHPQGRQPVAFGQADRFAKSVNNKNPGPGAYYNNQKDAVKKRLIEESQRKDIKIADNNGPNGIKISSIPSIPKKSATRVYEQLAPGILILHEQDYESANIGPGTYNINHKLTQPKGVSHKIAPEHVKKVVEEEQPEVNIPTMAEQIRNERRMMYKQNVIKNSTVNKTEINPSDLCLEVIILRQKLLRSDENPPPGYYHTDVLSDFKVQDQNKVNQNQYLGGKAKRFDELNDKSLQDIGPGAYVVEEDAAKRGGFIPKETRKLHAKSQDKPGPGAYITVKPKPKTDIKGNYPPIFGSGNCRFTSAPKSTITNAPGPGSYQIDKKKNKKQKYIKIRKELIEPLKDEMSMEPIAGFQSEFSRISNASSMKQRRLYQVEKNSSNFASNVERFQSDKTLNERIGPGNYDAKDISFAYRSFNRAQQGYVGNRMIRFDQTEIRPKIGPGTYNPGFETVKQKKIKNVFM